MSLLCNSTEVRVGNHKYLRPLNEQAIPLRCLWALLFGVFTYTENDLYTFFIILKCKQLSGSDRLSLLLLQRYIPTTVIRCIKQYSVNIFCVPFTPFVSHVLLQEPFNNQCVWFKNWFKSLTSEFAGIRVLGKANNLFQFASICILFMLLCELFLQTGVIQ